jgi:hypothetical protein
VTIALPQRTVERYQQGIDSGQNHKFNAIQSDKSYENYDKLEDSGEVIQKKKSGTGMIDDWGDI